MKVSLTPFSGLKKVDDYTLEISYKEFSASMLLAGGGVSSYVEPKHILEKTPIKDLEDSEQVRTNPVGFGPFKVKSITPGESVSLQNVMTTTTKANQKYQAYKSM